MKCFPLAAIVLALAGCSLEPTARDDRIELSEQRVFELKEISPQQGQAFLSELGFATTSVVPRRNAIAVRGSTGDLYRAGVVMDLVDSGDEFLVETLSSPSNARTVPANSRIAAALGNIAVGTFAGPPRQGERVRAIIDVHGDSIVAIIPVRIQKDLVAFIEYGDQDPRRSAEPAKAEALGEQAQAQPAVADGNEPSEIVLTKAASLIFDVAGEVETCEPRAPSECVESLETAMAEPNAPPAEDEPRRADENTSSPADKPAMTKRLYAPAPLANGEDVLQLDLPDQVEVSQLLDLAAEYLHLDYMYDSEAVRGQSVSLRLHGKLQGEIRVKDLYPLLESVLKFKGFAMTRHQDNLVTIIPLTQAMQADPALVDPNGTGLEAGNMVVTRVFNLRSVSPVSAMNLLDSMQISVATSIVEETRSLIVTCYAHRMERIERLLEMVDRPGRSKAFRCRELKHTTAGTLCRKVELLVSELQTSPVEMTPMNSRASGPGLLVRAPLRSSAPDSRSAVDGGLPDLGAPRALYLDADARTNRILMVGDPEQLAMVEEVIEALDVAQQELRTFKVYEIKHVDAGEVRQNLVNFDLIEDKTVGPQAPPFMVDSPPPDGVQTVARTADADRWDVTDRQKPQASVLASSNSLLISATPVQHVRIGHLIEHVDTLARQEAIPYEIYFLENQDPEHMSEVLRRLLQETITDDDSKIRRVAPKPEDEIVIVADKNTFSLIVYASRKNQDWIRKLIKTLDKRRPQVLIDATLVEIRKNDQFNYDLEVVAGLPNLTSTSGVVPEFTDADGTTVTERLQQSGRSRFAEFHMKSGKGIGFYADEHIQALLTAVQSKDYGRVLAKPKVLVNDNEKGNIKTADTTYVVTKSSVPVAGGTAGQQNQLIETAIGYEPYEAGINLEITPHISDGDLLRLEIELTRSDFTSVSNDKPPNQTSSNVGTVVTVPDGSTIILGGMLKLNQSKGGSKIPILGDLPLIGGVFRSVDTSDVQSMLYIFVRAQVIRPAETDAGGYEDLKRISEANREAFEGYEQEFQNYQTWPGVKPKTVSPPKVLNAR